MSDLFGVDHPNATNSGIATRSCLTLEKQTEIGQLIFTFTTPVWTARVTIGTSSATASLLQ